MTKRRSWARPHVDVEFRVRSWEHRLYAVDGVIRGLSGDIVGGLHASFAPSVIGSADLHRLVSSVDQEHRALVAPLDPEITGNMLFSWLGVGRVTVGKKYRGQNIGWEATAQLLDVFGEGSCALTLYPAPVSRRPTGKAEVFEKLRRYWSDFGLHALSPEAERAKIYGHYCENKWPDKSYMARRRT